MLGKQGSRRIVLAFCLSHLNRGHHRVKRLVFDQNPTSKGGPANDIQKGIEHTGNLRKSAKGTYWPSMSPLLGLEPNLAKGHRAMVALKH